MGWLLSLGPNEGLEPSITTNAKASKLVNTFLRGFYLFGAAGRTRTVTPFGREILSLLCLPISPPRR